MATYSTPRARRHLGKASPTSARHFKKHTSLPSSTPRPFSSVLGGRKLRTASSAVACNSLQPHDSGRLRIVGGVAGETFVSPRFSLPRIPRRHQSASSLHGGRRRTQGFRRGIGTDARDEDLSAVTALAARLLASADAALADFPLQAGNAAYVTQLPTLLGFGEPPEGQVPERACAVLGLEPAACFSQA